MRRFLLAAAVLVAVVLAAGVRAETVVLVDGTSLEGQISTHNGRVTIVTADATLTLPADKVLRVGKAPALKTACKPAKAKPASAAPNRPAAPKLLARAMARKIDVAFDGVAPSEAFDYLRQITKINLVLDNDVRTDTRAVTLTLHDVSLADVLEMLKQMNGYTYEVRAGQILFVRGRGAAPEYVTRVYDVRDLLVSTADMGTGPLGQGGNSRGTGLGGLSTGGATSGGRGNMGRGLNPQFAPGRAGPVTVTGRGRSAGGGPSAGSRPFALTSGQRTLNLALMITLACGPGSWAQPPVIVP